jgi:hypothetical protein
MSLRTVHKQFLAITKVSSQFLEHLFNYGLPQSAAVHGVRNIKIINVSYNVEEGLVYILFTSPDIPAYVAVQRSMECLHCILAHDRDGELIALPEVKLEFESYHIQPPQNNINNEEQYGEEYDG